MPLAELAALVKLGRSDCLADAETRPGCADFLAELTISGEPNWEPRSAGAEASSGVVRRLSLQVSAT